MYWPSWRSVWPMTWLTAVALATTAPMLIAPAMNTVMWDHPATQQKAANLSMTLLKEINNALSVGPILMGTRQPAHFMAPSVTSRGIVNMAAIAATEALAGD
jgi:hypothetical protein